MNKTRESGIELLKIIAIFLIVISHTNQTLTQTSSYISEYAKSFFDLNNFSLSLQIVVLQISRYFGSLGNCIFFVCSAWFLCDNNKTKSSKIIHMIIDVFVISMIITMIYLLSSEDISSMSLKSLLLPTTSQNNWYITCYLIFYAIHDKINIIFENISQETHIRINIVLIAIYVLYGMLFNGAFEANNIVRFVVIYFIIAYIKKYMQNYCSNTKLNKIVLLVSIIGFIGLIVLSDVIGIYIPIKKLNPMRWNSQTNLFILMISISSLMIFKNLDIHSKVINEISSLSMLIYLIHENILFRSYTRVRIEYQLLEQFGRNNAVLIILLFSIVLLLASTIVAFVYQNTIQKATGFIANKVDELYTKIINKITKRIKESTKPNN